jgi:epsin
MDRLEALGSQLSKITIYDIKSAYNQVSKDLSPEKQDARAHCYTHCCVLKLQAKNMVLNVSEMEAKVQEATNDDPWSVRRLI